MRLGILRKNISLVSQDIMLFDDTVRANVAYNPDSELIPVSRSNGVLVANVSPQSGLISGQSSLMMLDGWTWENATLNHPTALHITWPSMKIHTGKDAKRKEEQIDERQKN